MSKQRAEGLAIFRIVVASVFLCGAMASIGAGQVLFDQPPVAIGNPAAGAVSLASTGPMDEEVDDTIPTKSYDNFDLGSDVVLTGVNWKGLFNGVFNPDTSVARSDIDFELTIYSNAEGNAPDISNVLFSTVLEGGSAGIDNGTQVQKALVANETSRNGGAVLDYSATVDSVNLDAGSYWLAIQAKMNFPSGEDFLDPAWAWVLSDQGDGLSFNYDNEFDDAEPGLRLTTATCNDFGLPGCDAAFELIGTVVDEECDPNTGGDLNGDGMVDFADFLTLSNNFGNPANSHTEGDVDCDGVVGFSDFLILSGNFGQEVGGAESVPEPAGFFLIGFAAVAGLHYRRRR